MNAIRVEEIHSGQTDKQILLGRVHVYIQLVPGGLWTPAGQSICSDRISLLGLLA